MEISEKSGLHLSYCRRQGRMICMPQFIFLLDITDFLSSFLDIMPTGVYSLRPLSHTSINLAQFLSLSDIPQKFKLLCFYYEELIFPSFEVFMPANAQTLRTPATSLGFKRSIFQIKIALSLSIKGIFTCAPKIIQISSPLQ